MSTGLNIDPFAELLEGKKREAYEAFGPQLYKWLEDHAEASGMEFADVVDAAAFVFSSVVSCYVLACVDDDDKLTEAKEGATRLVNLNLTKCFDLAKETPLKGGFSSVH